MGCWKKNQRSTFFCLDLKLLLEKWVGALQHNFPKTTLTQGQLFQNWLAVTRDYVLNQYFGLLPYRNGFELKV